MSSTYLYTAFIIVWVVLIGYIITLIRTRKQINDEIKILEAFD